MKLLTFLGVANYAETAYTYQGQECVTRYAPAAASHFLLPDQVTVFLTEEAEQQVYPAFQTALPPGLKTHAVPVPHGEDNQQLWQIFNQISSAVQPGEEVAFDITHGLRSFPLIGLLAAAYLRAGLGVNLRAVLYGAYDVRDTSVTPHRTPMFDLSPMLSLLEWATAADRFNRTGDSRYLASLVKSQRKELAQAAQGDALLLEQVGHLGNLAGALNSISQSLHLIRPHQTMMSVAGLTERMIKAQPALKRSAPASPFALILDSIVQAYQPLALEDPAESSTATLEVERRMIHWYVERELWVQAVSLAREWLLSWVMLQLGLTNLTQLSARQRTESVLGAEANEFLEASRGKLPFSPVFLARLPQSEVVLGLWLSLTAVRNDIDHAGMREDPKEPETLISQIKACIQTLDNFPL